MPSWLPWLWLVPLALLTLYVWAQIARDWLYHRIAADLRATRQRLDARAETPPCALCGSATHSYTEHVRIPQAELAARDEDEAWRCEGEW
jgi:hypothetical protein